MTPQAKAEKNTALRKEIKELDGVLHKMESTKQRVVVALSNRVYRVQKGQLFRDWVNPKTRKYFTSFKEWIDTDVSYNKTMVYGFIGIKEHLKQIPDAELETIGVSRCFELSKVAKEKPKLLQKFVTEIRKNPKITTFSLKQMVTNATAGSHFDSGQYERLDFAVKAEDAPEVNRAFAVMQAIDPIKTANDAVARGLHLVNLCRDYLSGSEERKVLKRLEDAGEFKNGTRFEIVEA